MSDYLIILSNWVIVSKCRTINRLQRRAALHGLSAALKNVPIIKSDFCFVIDKLKTMFPQATLEYSKDYTYVKGNEDDHPMSKPQLSPTFR